MKKFTRAEIEALISAAGTEDFTPEGHPGPVDLSGLNGVCIDLAGADLSHLDLSGLNLSRANLDGARLCHTLLCGCNLQGASLEGADLSGAICTDSNMSRGYLRWMTCQGTDFTGVDFSFALLTSTDLSTAIFGNNDFTSTELSGLTLPPGGVAGISGR